LPNEGQHEPRQSKSTAFCSEFSASCDA
jgi:hypothetical protein